LAKDLHNISDIIVVEHEDCGYYKAVYDIKEDRVELHKRNAVDFIRAMQALHPELKYSAYMAMLNGDFIEFY
jgi:carbonic anhydrase